MKTLKCDICDATAQGETFEDWMQALMPHYKEAHADVMQQHSGNPEEMKTKMETWMKENKERFDTA